MGVSGRQRKPIAAFRKPHDHLVRSDLCAVHSGDSLDDSRSDLLANFGRAARFRQPSDVDEGHLSADGRCVCVGNAPRSSRPSFRSDARLGGSLLTGPRKIRAAPDFGSTNSLLVRRQIPAADTNAQSFRRAAAGALGRGVRGVPRDRPASGRFRSRRPPDGAG